ncbi:MAG TPA: hypothetical protein VK348_06405 [Planctomycetota bacterium]|nr:hypothetical protein [Planctomycetota bacterium]
MWDDLFVVRGIEVVTAWPAILIGAASAMLLLPWVWALATWLPNGRMAIGATALLTVLLGLAAFGVVRNCPQIELTLGWQSWLWLVAPLGLVVAWVSWVRGRRGGGHLRSAKLGAGALAIGLLPPAGWLGSQAWEYHHPDLQALVNLGIDGLSPDLHFALGRGAHRLEWYGVPVRIDLQTGVGEQIGGINTHLGVEILRPFSLCPRGQQRYWHCSDYARDLHAVYDLTTGVRTEVQHDAARHRLELPADLQAHVVADLRATTPFRAPGNRPAWIADGTLFVEQADGSCSRTAWPEQAGYVRPAGHGIMVFSGAPVRLYDLTRRAFIVVPKIKASGGFAVQGIWLVESELPVRANQSHWHRFDPDREVLDPCPELANCSLLALLDDEEVLVLRHRPGFAEELFAYRPRDRKQTSLPPPPEFVAANVRWCFASFGSSGLARNPYGLRDPRGRLWVVWSPYGRQDPQMRCLAIDPATRTVQQVLVGDLDILAFPDEHSVLALEARRRIVRIDLATGDKTVLFPRTTP